jgi:class 3 adenylate cyclase
MAIGIHLGDVLVEDDILSDGVNIAARLEGVAEPTASASPMTLFAKCAAKSKPSLPISASRTSKTSPDRCAPTGFARPSLTRPHGTSPWAEG